MSVMIDLQPSAGPALVVGGGDVAARKVRTLVEGGFEVVVIAAVVQDGITPGPGLTVHRRPFAESDLPADARYALVFACTDSRETNARVGALARAARVLVVVADAQEESTFYTPAAIRDGDLIVAVSTGGASPALARELRERIVAALGPGWAQVVTAARQERQARLRDARAGREAGE